MNKVAKIETPEKAVAHGSLYVALAAAQAEMGKALKESTNPHFRSKYADLSSVMDACMPALSRHGIAVLQPAYDDETGRYIKTIFVHGESGETAECRVPLIISKDDMQGYGSAATYARRYGLMGMAGIAPEDDDGNAAAKAAPKGTMSTSDAWKDSVEDSIPDGATDEERAQAFADAICKDFAGNGRGSLGAKALSNRWDKHQPMINRFADRYPDLHGMVVDAYENAQMAQSENYASQ